jgi:hypothetical protein
MSVITKGKTFANGEQLTAGKLNQMLDAAVFSSAAVDNTKTTLSGGAITIAPNAITSTEIAQSFLDKIYPIGSIYTNATDSTNPGTLLGFGTWVSFGAGRVPVGIDSSDTDFDTAEEVGGSKTKSKTIAINEIPEHAHGTPLQNSSMPSNFGTASGTFNNTKIIESASTVAASFLTTKEVFTGSGTKQTQQAMNLDVVQPYIVVYMWKRTA